MDLILKTTFYFFFFLREVIYMADMSPLQKKQAYLLFKTSEITLMDAKSV